MELSSYQNGSSLGGGVQYLNDQCIEVDTGVGRGLRYQAVIGHAGHGVHFDQPELTVAIAHAVDTPPALTWR